MAEALRQGRASDGLKKTAPAPKPPVGKSESNPFKGVSNDLKLLLRADRLPQSKINPFSVLVTLVTYDTPVFESIKHIGSPSGNPPRPY